MNKDFYNASGCADPTAYRAMRNIDRTETAANANQLIKTLKALIAQNGFTLLNRIEIKDIKSGTFSSDPPPVQRGAEDRSERDEQRPSYSNITRQ